MTKNKLAIIGGSGLYEINGLEKPKWKSLTTPWGKPSDEILNFKYKGKEVCFLPRHARGHKISPTNINFRANIDALKQLGVTDIISVSAVGSLKEDLPPGKFVIVDQFIDRTFARNKTFFNEDIGHWNKQKLKARKNYLKVMLLLSLERLELLVLLPIKCLKSMEQK